MGYHGAPKEGISAFVACSALIKVNWGIGMMAMPYYLHKAGVQAGVAFFIFTMGLTYLSIDRLLRCADELAQRHARTADAIASLLEDKAALDTPLEVQAALDKAAQKLTFSGVVGGALGPIGEAVCVACIALSCIGSCIAYLKFIGDNMSSFVGGSLWHWVLGATFPVTLLTWLDDVSFLAGSNILGIALAVGFAVVIVVNAASSLSASDFAHTRDQGPAINPSVMNLAVATGLAVFCNEGIVVLSPAVRNSMQRPETYRTVLASAMVVFTVCYMIVALCGYTLYQGRESELSLSLPHGSLRSSIAVVLYCCQLVPSFAVVYFMAVEASEDAYLRLWCGHVAGRDMASAPFRELRSRFVACRTTGVWVSGVVALLVPSFGDFLALSGAVANSLSIYILPHLCYLAVFSNREQPHVAAFDDTDEAPGPSVPPEVASPLFNHLLSPEEVENLSRQRSRASLPGWDFLLSSIIILFGVVTSVVGTYASVVGLLK